MNIHKLSGSLNSPKFKSSIQTKCLSYFTKNSEIGEGASIACDFLGKAAIVPAVIMLTSKEPKEKKQYSALKNPVAATIQLALEVPILAVGSKIVGNLADKGVFDVENSEFSYNALKKKDEFISTLKNISLNSKEAQQKEQDILEALKTGSKDLSGDVLNLAKLIDENSSAILKTSFEAFEKAKKNQFHLKNRICFLAAILLTPVLCALENKIHPIIMNKFFEKQDKHPSTVKFMSMNEFSNQTKPQGGTR